MLVGIKLVEAGLNFRPNFINREQFSEFSAIFCLRWSSASTHIIGNISSGLWSIVLRHFIIVVIPVWLVGSVEICLLNMVKLCQISSLLPGIVISTHLSWILGVKIFKVLLVVTTEVVPSLVAISMPTTILVSIWRICSIGLTGARPALIFLDCRVKIVQFFSHAADVPVVPLVVATLCQRAHTGLIL
jgi:hypothetical protein